jgi:hypothetical protein
MSDENKNCKIRKITRDYADGMLYKNRTNQSEYSCDWLLMKIIGEQLNETNKKIQELENEIKNLKKGYSNE